jgi:hypothetical protein
MSDEFFVGYLDAPPGAARRMRRVAATLILFAVAAALALALATGPFDRSSYEFTTVSDWEGSLELAPAPALIVTTRVAPDSPMMTVERFPLVAQGKHGADALIAGLDGATVHLKARRIVREGTTMLEIVPGSIERRERAQPATKIEDLGSATFSGEIVDSKCFLGVMNPGRLEVHRACAIRCIAGGIPPMLFVKDDKGREAHLLLVDAKGQPMNDRVLDLVAQQVTIEGRLERRDDLDYLYVFSVNGLKSVSRSK